MGQFGMNLPGGRRMVGSASPGVYDGLLAAAVVALAAACVVVWMQGSIIGPDGSAIGTHPRDASTGELNPKEPKLAN